MTSKSSTSAEITAEQEKAPHCDPCEWRVADKDTRKMKPCGWVGKAIRAHLKSHRDSRGNAVTFEQYAKKYPGRNYGDKPYTPSEAEIQRFREANPKHRDPTDDVGQLTGVKEDRAKRRAAETAVEARTAELWQMVQRDPAAKIFCEQVAEEEQSLRERRQLYKDADHTKHPRHKERSTISKDISEAIERLDKLYKSLNITVEQRRKNNVMGDDTPAQLIAGFANAWRKMSPEGQAIMRERVASLRMVVDQRIRINQLSQVPDVVEDRERSTDESSEDLEQDILDFGKRNDIK